MPNVITRRKRLRLPRRFVVPAVNGDAPFVIWLGLPFVKWFTGHDCLTIYDVVFAAPRTLYAQTVAHEAFHVRQWRRMGFWRFVRLYLKELRRVGYDSNILELAARQYAESHAMQYQGIV